MLSPESKRVHFCQSVLTLPAIFRPIEQSPVLVTVYPDSEAYHRLTKKDALRGRGDLQEVLGTSKNRDAHQLVLHSH